MKTDTETPVGRSAASRSNVRAIKRTSSNKRDARAANTDTEAASDKQKASKSDARTTKTDTDDGKSDARNRKRDAEIAKGRRGTTKTDARTANRDTRSGTRNAQPPSPGGRTRKRAAPAPTGTSRAARSPSRSGRGTPPPDQAAPRKRGRPPGSKTFNPETAARIVSMIRAGALPHDAAEACGIGLSTFYEWIARGEGRHPRDSSPKLAAFAKAVRMAESEARVAAAILAYQKNVIWWLANAPVPPGHQGFGRQVASSQGGPAELADEEADAEIARLVQALVEAGEIAPPGSGQRGKRQGSPGGNRR